MDPPQHTHHRAIFEPFFNRQAAEALRPAIQAKVQGARNSGGKVLRGFRGAPPPGKEACLLYSSGLLQARTGCSMHPASGG
jgi:hypothetical protein